MKVAVPGGTGQIGTPVVAELSRRGHEVLALSRSVPSWLPDGVAHRSVDLVTGAGLDEALSGVEAVVDASSDPKRPKKVMRDGARNLTEAELRQGVSHHVAISIVGCEHVPFPYYRIKVAEEERIESGQVPWSLLRATQFHTLVELLFKTTSRFGFLPAAKAPGQPVDPDDVAVRLADLVEAGPSGRAPEISGPETTTLAELARTWKQITGSRAVPVPVPMFGKFGRAVRAGKLCNDAAQVDGLTFAEWLERHRGR